ncbi:MAG TPA: class I SAM-dependent methyltransferase [Nocardioides sp.]|nr:class I SAM-dependent methyltransferase [Nocardioides sp.]
MEDHRALISESYDTWAEPYTELFGDAALARAADRAQIALLASLVREAGGGLVADLGCGPGHWSAYLHDHGVDVVGIDLSPRFVATARLTYAEIEFVQGSMTDLEADDASLAGALAWYSLIHTPPDALGADLTAVRRMLAHDAPLLVGFGTTDPRAGDPLPVEHKVAPAYRWPVDAMVAVLRDAGFTEVSTTTRRPEPDERSAQAYLLVRAA